MADLTIEQIQLYLTGSEDNDDPFANGGFVEPGLMKAKLRAEMGIE